jgi:hypothetical protein
VNDNPEPREQSRSQRAKAAYVGRLRELMPYMIWVGVVSVIGLAVTVVLRLDVPGLRAAFMGGIAIAGTVAYLLQAQRKCPNCGAPYGYQPRVIKSSTCRSCGAEFPPWPNDQ